MANIPFVRGQNVKLKLFQEGVPIILAAKNWKIEQVAEEVADPVNGEDRDRLDLVTNFYKGTVDVYQADMELMDGLIAAQDASDAQGLPLKQTAAVSKKMRDGTMAAYQIQEAVFGPWGDDSSGRAEANMLNLSFRFRYWKKVPGL